MKRQHTYEKLLHQKLNGLSAPDAAGLWGKMEEILDREMPVQEEKKRRIGAWWMNANLLVAASLFLAVGSVYTLCQVSGKQSDIRPLQTATTGVGHDKQPTAFQSAPSNEPTKDNQVSARLQPATATVVNGHQKANLESSVQVTNPAVNETQTVQPMNSTDAEQVLLETTGIMTVEGTKPGDDLTIVANEAAEPVVEEESTIVLSAAAKNIAPVSTTVPFVFAQQEVKAMASEVAIKKAKRNRIFVDKGVSIGLALNAPLAIAQQQRNELDLKGQKNPVQDYLPSVYAQLHLSKKFYVQAEWQPVAAQYTPNFTLYDRTDVLNPDEKEQKVVKLNKVFYSSVPVSFHYKTPVKNLTVGVGLQYSKLKKVLLQDQEYYHLIQAGGGFKVEERKNEVAVKDPEAVRSHSTSDVVDSVARSIRREDWRLLADVGYHYKGFNLGVRYTQGLQHFVNTNFTNLAVKERNQSLQVYLRYNLFDSRKK